MTMYLSQIYKVFPTEEKFIKHLESVLWGEEAKCPYCNATYSTPIPTNRYKCMKCNTSFSITTHTFLHKTRVDLRKWVYVIDIVVRDKDISVRDIGKQIGVTKDTALYMLNRTKEANRQDSGLLTRILNNQNFIYDKKSNSVHP